MSYLNVVFFVLEQITEATAVLTGTVKQYTSPALHFRVNHRKRRLTVTIEDDD